MNIENPSLGARIFRGRALRHALPLDALIATSDGARRVAELCVADRLPGPAGLERPLRALRTQNVPTGETLVFLPAHALGAGKPLRDTYLPLNQPLVIEGWRAQTLYGAPQALVAAGRLVDGQVITRALAETPRAMRVLHCDQPCVIAVNGLRMVTAGSAALVTPSIRIVEAKHAPSRAVRPSH